MPTSFSRREFAKATAGGVAALAGCGSDSAPPEQAASRKIVDPHVHVWVNDPKYPWPAENLDPPKEDATPEMLLELMARHGVSNTVIVHPFHYRWDCRYVGDTLKKYPQRFQGVCRVNPEATDAADELSKWTEEWGFKGVRLSPNGDPSGDWINNGNLMHPIWSRAEQLRVPVQLLTVTSRLPACRSYIEKYPDLDVVIDHMADCPIDASPEELDSLLTLAQFPRVYCKITHPWVLTKQAYPYRDTWDLVKKVYDAFGPDRLMWGTDWPVSGNRLTYGQALELVRDEMDFFTAEDKDWILGKTIKRLWPFAEGV